MSSAYLDVQHAKCVCVCVWPCETIEQGAQEKLTVNDAPVVDPKHLATTCVWLVCIFLHVLVENVVDWPAVALGSLGGLPMWHEPPSLRLVLPSAGFTTFPDGMYLKKTVSKSFISRHDHAGQCNHRRTP
jgi:hypothetical protein